jgi:hypothetical protein
VRKFGPEHCEDLPDFVFARALQLTHICHEQIFLLTAQVLCYANTMHSFSFQIVRIAYIGA